MAAHGENETIIRIDHDYDQVYVYSTRRSWWNRCERLGMTLREAYRPSNPEAPEAGREYVGSTDRFRASVNARRRMTPGALAAAEKARAALKERARGRGD